VARPKNAPPVPESVDDRSLLTPDATSVVSEATTTDDVMIDADLDRAPVDSVGDAVPDSGGESDSSSAADGRHATKAVKILLVAAVGAFVAVAAIFVANAVGGDTSGGSIPLVVSSPDVVVGALVDAGFDCRGSVVAGNVATCNSTVAVRIFADEAAAQTWVDDILRDPLTNSSVGWVRHGNAVVAAPLGQTPEIADALGAGSKKF